MSILYYCFIILLVCRPLELCMKNEEDCWIYSLMIDCDCVCKTAPNKSAKLRNSFNNVCETISSQKLSKPLQRNTDDKVE